MRSDISSRRTAAGLIAILLIVLLPVTTWSQAAPDAAPESAVEAPAEEAGAAGLIRRLDVMNERLMEIEDYLRKPAPELAGITVALPDRAREAGTVIGGLEGIDISSTDAAELQAVLQRLRNLDRIFTRWRERLNEEITLLDPWREQLRSDAQFLEESAQTANTEATEMPEALRTRLQELAREVDATRDPLRRRLDAVTGADVRVEGLQTSLRELAGELESARLVRQQRPLALSAPPIWRPPEALKSPVAVASESLRVLRAGIREHFNDNRPQFVAFAVILFVFLFAMLKLRRSILSRTDTTGPVEREPDALLARYPVAVTLFVWTLIGPSLLLPDLPLVFNLSRGIAYTVLLGRVLPVLVAPMERTPLRVLLLLAAALLLQLTFLPDDWYGRIVNILVGLAALWAFRNLARQPPTGTEGRALFRRALHAVARIAPVIVVIGVLAEVVGARALGQQAIGGILFVTLSMCTLLAADAMLSSMLDAWVDGPGSRWFRSVRHWPEPVRLWGGRVIRLVLIAAFIGLLPSILPLLEPLWGFVGDLLTTPVELGNLTMSLGDVIGFIVGIFLALGVARFVRFVIDEDVLPKLPMTLGAASAASRLIYYLLVVIGILFALAASGVELTRLTLVVSALGIGIGFGLQNIVNNFVSGIIIAFERPVREGDVITLGAQTGRVQQIGLRATRLRRTDGAEVIVPNGTLISAEVTNWTLTDRSRRVEIDVSAAWDSDPARVTQLLTEAVTGQPGVAERPAPTVSFKAFGPASTEFALYLWTADVSDRSRVESEARARALRALKNAGLERKP